MEVIYTTDLSRPGNDVYIYESISLIKPFQLYAVIKVWKFVAKKPNYLLYNII